MKKYTTFYIVYDNTNKTMCGPTHYRNIRYSAGPHWAFVSEKNATKACKDFQRKYPQIEYVVLTFELEPQGLDSAVIER